MRSHDEEINSALTSCGFQKEEVNSSEFDAAFVRRGLLTSLVFLVKNVSESDFNAISVKNLVNSGRQWCTSNLRTRWIVKESGLNLVLLHEGQIDSKDIEGQVDVTGFHGAICQSITTLNVSNLNIEQEKTWVIIGKVRKALWKLRTIL